VDGTLSDNTPPKLTVMSGDREITVIVSAKTQYVRGHGSRSSLSEFTMGDRIVASGSFETDRSTFDARRIRDLSIAYTNVVGNVDRMVDDGVTLLPARRGSPHSPYWRGEVIDVSLLSTTKVMSGSVNLMKKSGVTWRSAVNWERRPPLHVRVTGLYNTANHKLPTLRADAVRILGTPGQPHRIATPTPTPTG
jgi:hypothetical protein